ncbi:MAG: hypothetical protein F7B60_05020 [Desulfurococcales archaeon]|nr:hypothetical protein [Desulfurococcales archaeon]
MLALRIHERNDLESKRDVLDSIARDLLNNGVESGVIRIYSYPSIDAIFSSSLLFFNLQRLGIHATMTISVDPPKYVKEPHIIIGYSSPKISDNKSSSMRVCITKKLTEPPSPNTFCLEYNSSLGVAVATFLEGAGVLSKESSQLSLFSVYLSSKTLRPITTDIDRAYINDWVSRREFEDTSLREDLLIQGIDSYSILDSLYYTIEPLIPGLTGDRQSIVEEFKSRGIESLLTEKAGNVEDKDMAEILKLIVSKINEHSKKKIDPRDLIGEVIISRKIGLDFVSLKRILYYAIAREGTFNPVTRLVYDPSSFVAVYLKQYERLIDELKIQDNIRRSFVRFERIRRHPWLNLYLVQGVPVEYIHIIGFNLRLNGFIEEESIVAVKGDNERLSTTLSEIEYGQDQDIIKKLEAQMTAKLVNARVFFDFA